MLQYENDLEFHAFDDIIDAKKAFGNFWLNLLWFIVLEYYIYQFTDNAYLS